MTAAVLFREAKEDDASDIAHLLVHSIRYLCGLDHGGAERPLQQWLANKTPGNVRRWLENPENIILVAEVGGQTAAVGGVQRGGTVILNYVAPAFRFQGVSKAMMAELERRARQLGLQVLTLESTHTAHAFYLALGYVDEGEAGAKHGLSNFPMRKAIG